MNHVNPLNTIDSSSHYIVNPINAADGKNPTLTVGYGIERVKLKFECYINPSQLHH